tara:strand:- start:38003 stop:38128 length:126 start_codon:yes stop_codon:yes gene_type:complete
MRRFLTGSIQQNALIFAVTLTKVRAQFVEREFARFGSGLAL